MIHLLRACRLYYVLPISSILPLTIWYAIGDAMADQWPMALWATIALSLVLAGGYVLNDVCDRHVDRINAPHRPIASADLNVPVAVGWACILVLAGLALALLCRWQFLVTLCAITAGLVFYDLTSKRLGTAKSVVSALLMTSLYPLAFAYAGTDATGSRVATLYLFPVWMFLTSFSYGLLKDIRDITGDQTVGDTLTWIQRRPERARVVASILTIAGALVLLGPAWAGCGWVYLSLIPLAIILAIWSTFWQHRPAIMILYGEFVAVGIATSADIIILGS